MRRILLLSCVILFILLCLGTMDATSPICDEVAHHVANGYSYLKTWDFRMNPSTPALSRELIGLPLLFFSPNLPIDHVSWEVIDSPTFGRLFFYEYGNDPDKILFWSRVPVMILSVFLALLIYIWARKFFGENAALLSVLLYLFSPAVIGNSTIAMSDISAALFIFLAVFQFWRFLEKRTGINLILTGICFGLAQSSKHTAIILFPLYVILGAVYISNYERGWRPFLRLMRDMMLIWVIAFFALWATYFFEFKPLLLNAPDVEEKVQYIRKFSLLVPFFNQELVAEKLIYFAKEVPIPLSTFSVSLLGVLHEGTIGQGTFFMGKNPAGGSRIYYVVDYLIKTPLPVLILLVSSIWFSIRHKRTKLSGVRSCFMLLPMILMFTSASITKVQGGVRYLLPAYPFLFMWMGDTVNVSFSGKKEMLYKTAIAILCAWYLWIAASTYPHYLAYHNEFVGGIEGTDNGLTHDADWGQDLKPLGKYLKSNNIDEVVLTYFGTANPAHYGINYHLMSPEEMKAPQKKVYAISVLYLDNAEWTKDHEPTAKAGYTIFIYDFRE